MSKSWDVDINTCLDTDCIYAYSVIDPDREYICVTVFEEDANLIAQTPLMVKLLRDFINIVQGNDVLCTDPSYVRDRIQEAQNIINIANEAMDTVD